MDSSVLSRERRDRTPPGMLAKVSPGVFLCYFAEGLPILISGFALITRRSPESRLSRTIKTRTYAETEEYRPPVIARFAAAMISSVRLRLIGRTLSPLISLILHFDPFNGLRRTTWKVCIDKKPLSTLFSERKPRPGGGLPKSHVCGRSAVYPTLRLRKLVGEPSGKGRAFCSTDVGGFAGCGGLGKSHLRLFRAFVIFSGSRFNQRPDTWWRWSRSKRPPRTKSTPTTSTGVCSFMTATVSLSMYCH